MKRNTIFFQSGFQSNRLDYILHEILVRRLGLNFKVAGLNEPLPEGAVAIRYGVDESGKPAFSDSGILEQTGTSPVSFSPGFENYFLDAGRGKTKNDLFGASFYLLSRFEEQTFQTESDEHGRFPDSAQLAVEFRKMPLVEFWVNGLRRQLEDFGIKCKKDKPELTFSIDWDNPTAYREKGIWRNSASLLNDVLSGNFRAIGLRLAVLSGKSEDPYDHLGKAISMELIKDRRIFFWTGDYGKHDKGLSWQNSWYRQQIKALSRQMIPGLHPSYATFQKPDRMAEEKKRLEEIIGQPVDSSRFHFLRYRIPASFRLLEELGFKDDFSMGFSAFPGFRAGTALPFHWFDLKKNQAGNLCIHPFSLMDSSVAFRGKGPEIFLEHAAEQLKTGEQLGFPVHAIFHNEHPSCRHWENAITAYLNLQKD
jgi:hypothetical protein